MELNNIDIKTKGYHVYEGRLNGKLVYIGTTIQRCVDRWRWHRSNGKRLEFKKIHSFDNSDEMLEKEFQLIKEYKPKLNKIVKRKQNLNKKLSQEDLDKRKDSSEWCQGCLKRRVNSGYSKCFYCN